MFKGLKVDPSLQHHYIISVRRENNVLSEKNEIFLRYGPIYFNNKDVENLRDSLVMMDDKLFKVTKKESLDMYNVNDIVNSLSMMMIASRVNNCTNHHFSMDIDLGNDASEWFNTFIESCNHSKEFMEKLRNAKI